METVSIDALGSSTEQMPIKPELESQPRDGAAFDEAVSRFRAAMGEGLGGLDLGGLGIEEDVTVPVADGFGAKVPDADDFGARVPVADDFGAKAPVAEAPDAKAPAAEAPDVDDLVADVPDGGAASADPSAVVNPMAYNPIADAPVVQQVVADTMKVAAVDSAESVRSAFLASAVEEVCEAIQVAPGVQPGQGEVRIQLKADVLSGTEVFLEAKGTTITVAFNPATADVAEILSRNITQFQQHLAGRIHNYQIAAKIKLKS